MLQALALEGGAPGGATRQDAPPAHVTQRPQQIAHPLKSEHRIEEEDRQGRSAPGGVRGRQRGEGGETARLGDALFEQLTRWLLRVTQREICVDRDVAL